MKKHNEDPPSHPLGNHPELLARTILNSLTAHVAILDEEGYILETNRSWKKFAEENEFQMRPGTLKINYLNICDTADGYSADESHSVAKGIRDVIDGKIDEFVQDYPCHSPTEKRWFYMRVTRSPESGPIRIVVSHENITALKLAEEKQHKTEQALREEKLKLQESNTALKVLLQQRERDQKEMETRTLDNLRQTVFPILEQLEQFPLAGQALLLLSSLRSRLSELSGHFLKRLQAVETVLTPQEIQIANFIREGKRSKEIADILNLSITTVNFHRRNLRKKLGLNNTNTNLQSYLMRLTD
ncbi:helix-turn-helix domain-containing protein [Desulfogranum japonicum]|uniref:helix-turn-helix domain-containing protein n=1 Tax=Desulfogranum japonicum TaxID=231447 RepID=UPI00042748E1|nr:helix-turn-helix transcriptional regulator [Desulfogranum japonicum]